MDLPHNTVARWTKKMLEYHEKDLLDDWLELVEVLNSISEELNLESYEDEKVNEIYMFIRKITQSYLKFPEHWERRPRLEHLKEILAEHKWNKN